MIAVQIKSERFPSEMTLVKESQFESSPRMVFFYATNYPTSVIAYQFRRELSIQFFVRPHLTFIINIYYSLVLARIFFPPRRTISFFARSRIHLFNNIEKDTMHRPLSPFGPSRKIGCSRICSWSLRFMKFEFLNHYLTNRVCWLFKCCRCERRPLVQSASRGGVVEVYLFLHMPST